MVIFFKELIENAVPESLLCKFVIVYWGVYVPQ